MNNSQKHYLSQYCDLMKKWTGSIFDPNSEIIEPQLAVLGQKAMEQSGLNRFELNLIAMCRKYVLLNQRECGDEF